MDEISQRFENQKSGYYSFTNDHLRPMKAALMIPLFFLINAILFAINAIIYALFRLPKKGDLKLLQNWRGIQILEYLWA